LPQLTRRKSKFPRWRLRLVDLQRTTESSSRVVMTILIWFGWRKMLRGRFHLEPVILRYKPGRGRALIEKFEEEARSCSFAFVLMSPDD